MRAMTSEDLPAIAALHLANWRDSYGGSLSAEFLGQPVADEIARRWSVLPRDPDIALVAGEVDGFALVRTQDPDGPLLESLHVRQSARGGGLGRVLMAAVARQLIAAGYDNLWLEVFDANGAARAVYRRWGGIETPVFTDVIAGQNVQARKVRWHDLAPLIALDPQHAQ